MAQTGSWYRSAKRRSCRYPVRVTGARSADSFCPRRSTATAVQLFLCGSTPMIVGDITFPPAHFLRWNWRRANQLPEHVQASLKPRRQEIMAGPHALRKPDQKMVDRKYSSETSHDLRIMGCRPTIPTPIQQAESTDPLNTAELHLEFDIHVECPPDVRLRTSRRTTPRWLVSPSACRTGFVRNPVPIAVS